MGSKDNSSKVKIGRQVGRRKITYRGSRWEERWEVRITHQRSRWEDRWEEGRQLTKGQGRKYGYLTKGQGGKVGGKKADNLPKKDNTAKVKVLPMFGSKLITHHRS